jgi:hypothetical protein
MCDGQHCDHGVRYLVMDRVRESRQDTAMHTVLVAGPHSRAIDKFVDRHEDFVSESVGSERTTLSVP